jgi:hypothetical protein
MDRHEQIKWRREIRDAIEAATEMNRCESRIRAGARMKTEQNPSARTKNLEPGRRRRPAARVEETHSEGGALAGRTLGRRQGDTAWRGAEILAQRKTHTRHRAGCVTREHHGGSETWHGAEQGSAFGRTNSTKAAAQKLNTRD